jgi:hypothetical protein
VLHSFNRLRKWGCERKHVIVAGSDKPVEAGARNVIIDEAPMLTEEMLAALIRSFFFEKINYL